MGLKDWGPKVFGACVLAGAAAAAAIEPASAADIPARAPALKAPMAQPVAGWNGFYVGLHAGYGWMRSNVSRDLTINGIPTSYATADIEEVPATGRINASGFVGGGQIGVNQQAGRAVFGVEADLSYAGIRGSTTATGSGVSGGPPAPFNFVLEDAQKLRWLATLRARLGLVASDALLLYAIGGLAVGGLDESHWLQFIANTGYRGSLASTKAGWTAGGGAEHRLSGNWTAKIEYLYFDLGSTQVVAIDPNNPLNPVQARDRFSHTGHIARVGLNWQFN